MHVHVHVPFVRIDVVHLCTYVCLHVFNSPMLCSLGDVDVAHMRGGAPSIQPFRKCEMGLIYIYVYTHTYSDWHLAGVCVCVYARVCERKRHLTCQVLSCGTVPGGKERERER